MKVEHTATRKPRKCPACGGKKIAQIQYGLPAFDAEMDEKLQQGKIVLGGCCITDCDPRWQCVECNAQIYHSDDVRLQDL
jgi:hypothetical protein